MCLSLWRYGSLGKIWRNHNTDFYSKLNLEDISDAYYEHAKKVWEVFRIKNLGEYHDLYVQSNTLLLADVFENFRDKFNELYELDPVYFVFAPGLAWQACLKKTKVKLELLTDYDKLMMAKNGITGGICQVNSKYIKNYNKSIKSSYITFLHANNLYWLTMSQKLPANSFEWVNNLSKFNEDFIKKYDEDSITGYFLGVDVEYPTLFNNHKDLPFLAKWKKVEKVEKLICSIEDKEKYVIHIRALKQALNHGLKLKKVHRVIQFNQKAWLKPYIDMSTELRTGAQNKFEEDFF